MDNKPRLKDERPQVARPHMANGHVVAQSPFELKEAPVENFRPMKVIVIGAGFSGIYCGVRIPQRLRNVDLVIYEKNAGVGGTWWENRYPGCACDIPSHSYQYSFEPNPNWSSFYAPAKEICAYLQGVVDKYSAGRFIKCSHQVVDCEWDEGLLKWRVTVESLQTKETFVDEADIVISARGTLNNIAWPQIEGFTSMTIPVLHSARWDESFDFENKRVGIIGGGSSAIQIVPNLQKIKGATLNCFVRSRTWISRPFGDSAVAKLGLDSLHFTPEQKKRFVDDPEYFLRFRTTIEEEANSAHSLTLKGSEMQTLARSDFTDLMCQRLVRKPSILKSLVPGFSVGCRRLTPGPGYLEALVENNVNFIDTPIVRCHANGVELVNGTIIPLDVLVCATGFQASSPPAFPVRGRGSQTMTAKFHPYPETYLSLATDGFPNYMMMLGPNSAIGTGSLTMMMEMEGDYIIKVIRKMQKEDIRAMEVKSARVKDFSQLIDTYFMRTVYLDGCSSWYRSEAGKGNRITGLWPGSALHAMETFRSPRWEDYNYIYEGEEKGGSEEGNRLRWLGNGWTYAQREIGGDLAYYLRPEFTDVPASPFPEKSPTYLRRPFSY